MYMHGTEQADRILGVAEKRSDASSIHASIAGQGI